MKSYKLSEVIPDYDDIENDKTRLTTAIQYIWTDYYYVWSIMYDIRAVQNADKAQ